jgi:hypothetical protein
MNTENKVKLDFFYDQKKIAKFITERITNIYFAEVKSQNIFFRRISGAFAVKTYILKIIGDKNYYFDFYFEEIDRIIYFGVKFYSVVPGSHRTRNIFEINTKENFEELHLAIDKNMKKFLMERMY